MKVLFHIDESDRWTMTLGNAANLLQYGVSFGTPLEIEIVANGPAVCDLRAEAAAKLGIAAQLESLAPSVRICACNNALKANDITPEELYPFVQVVPAGVAEIALRQGDGFAYIKP